MKNLWITTTLLVSVTATMLSCSRNEKKPSDEIMAGDNPPQYSIEVPTEAEGCASFAGFIAQLALMPPDALMREVTVNLSVNDSNIDRTRPRANFLTVLNFSSLQYEQRTTSEWVSDFGAITQSGCSTVSWINPSGVIRNFQITEFTETSLKLRGQGPVADEAQNTEVRLEWIGPNELLVETDYPAMDFCPDYKSIRVSRQQRLRYGHPVIVQAQTTEQVDSRYLDRAVRAAVRAPASLSALDWEGVTIQAQNMDVAVADLEALTRSDVRVDLKTCPYRAKPPSGDEPLPPEAEPTPTPTPSPTPAPNSGQ